MNVITIPQDKAYFKRTYAGSPPKTTSLHTASLYKSKEYANKIAEGLRKKYKDVEFNVQPY